MKFSKWWSGLLTESCIYPVHNFVNSFNHKIANYDEANIYFVCQLVMYESND